jgi:thiol-disulfide isomerase/thioredoxin
MQLPASAQTDTISDSTAKEEMLIGKVNRSQLQTGEFGKYFINNYTNYAPDQKIINELKNKIYRYDIVVVLGTWCSDSHKEVPRFYKILDKLEYNTNSVEIICVDRNKTAGDVDVSSLDIERIPIFIFLIDGTEKGRIVETPNMSLEEDIYKILNN